MASFQWPPQNTGGTITVGSFSATPTTAGLSLSGTTLSLTAADATHPGGLSAADWVTFNSKQSALTLGNLTDAGTDGIVVTGGTGAIIGAGVSLAQHVADSTHNGYLLSTDWVAFNAKQAAGNYITALTGDVAASGPGSVAATLATVNGNVGSFTNASITVNGKGLVTAASSGTAPVTSISVASSNGFAGSSSGGATPALTLSTSITGILKGNGTAISAATSGTDYSLGTSSLATGILKSTTSTGALTIAVAGDFPTLNQNTSGSAASLSATLAIGSGGTGQTTKAAAFDALSPMTTGGDIIYGGASGTGTRLANGTAGQVLTSSGTTVAPTWSAPAIAATVGCAYTGQCTGTLNSSQNKTTYPTSVFDSGSAYSSGTFTVQSAGKYFVSASTYMSSSSSTWVGGIAIFKNGSSVSGITLRPQTASTYSFSVQALLVCAVNDTIEIYCDNNGSTAAYSSAADHHYLSIYKVGT